MDEYRYYFYVTVKPGERIKKFGLKEESKAKPEESREIIKLQTENQKPLYRVSHPKSTMQVILERRKYTFVQKKNSLFPF